MSAGVLIKLEILKVIFIISVLLFCNSLYAQQRKADKKQSKEDKRLLDSLIKNDEFLQLLNALDDNKSYFTVSLAASNKLASVNNNSINALQGNSKPIFTPGVSYSHKSGLGISATGYILNDEGNSGLHRVGVTPFYQFTNSDAFSCGASYTRFFSDEKYNAVASPIQNDFFINALYKKGFVEPGLSAGYSTGDYKEIDDITVNIPRSGRITIKDTAITSMKSVSLTGSVEHGFVLHQNMAKQTAFMFTPSLLINAGNNTFNVEHKNNYEGVIRGRGRRQLFRDQGASTGFEFQSAGLNLYSIYSIRKFSIQPQLYFDYYLQPTSENKFTQLYNVSVEYSF